MKPSIVISMVLKVGAVDGWGASRGWGLDGDHQQWISAREANKPFLCVEKGMGDGRLEDGGIVDERSGGR